MIDPPEIFLAKFLHFFDAPSPDRYAPLFHPEGTLEDAGMEAPLPADQTGAAIAQVLRVIPDLRIERVRHAVRGMRVFVEARNRASFAGRPHDWGAVYRVHLKDARVHRGRRFYDQAELLRPILPAEAALPPFAPHVHRAEGDADVPPASLPPLPDHEGIVAALAEAWAQGSGHALAALYADRGTLMAPGLDAPVTRADVAAYRRHLAATFGPIVLEPVDWAANGPDLFVEWRGRAQWLGAPATLDRIERYTIGADGRIAESRAYFDTLALIERANPRVAEVRAALIRR
jgi:ketosteroid isomerase-like protein